VENKETKKRGGGNMRLGINWNQKKGAAVRKKGGGEMLTKVRR